MGLLEKIVQKTLEVFSGGSVVRISEQLLFDKVIGFRSVVPGVGTSTIVQNVAAALSEKTNMSICVVDTNFLYGMMYPLLVGANDPKRKDYLDFTGELAAVVKGTTLRNVHLVAMHKRSVVDMLSSKDSEVTVKNLLGMLKTRFDIILVDLSHEMTNINTHFSVFCNRIINIADQSFKCTYNFHKSLSTMMTLAVPLAKADLVVLNKVVPDMLTDTKGAFEQEGLTVIGEIPFSLDIAKAGVTGKFIWSKKTTSRDISAFNTVINKILDNILQVTPLNKHYFDITTDMEERKPEIAEDLILEEVIVTTPSTASEGADSPDKQAVSESGDQSSEAIEVTVKGKEE